MAPRIEQIVMNEVQLLCASGVNAGGGVVNSGCGGVDTGGGLVPEATELVGSHLVMASLERNAMAVARYLHILHELHHS